MGTLAKKHNMEGEIVGTYFSIAKLGVFFTTIMSGYILESIGIVSTLQFLAGTVLLSIPFAYFYFSPVFHHERKKNIFHSVINSRD